MGKVRGVTSMKYPQLHQIPKDATATVRFLPDSDEDRVLFSQMKISQVHMQHEIPQHRGDSLMSIRGADGRIAIDIEAHPHRSFEEAFSPFPISSQHSYEGMQAMNRVRQMCTVNAIEIKYKSAPIPKRKKKSWLRYTSNKKWARRFPKRLIRQIGYPKVLSLPKDFLDKVKALQDKYPVDAAFLDGMTRFRRGLTA